MKFTGEFKVLPNLPAKLEGLRELAYNLYWTWQHDIQLLFRRLDRDLWEETHHNPVLMLGKISQERLNEAARDEGFIAHLKRAHHQLKSYLGSATWFSKNYSDLKNFNIIYFSFEYGLTECLQTYSGGLGVLAGDHLKSASDLGIPLTGIGVAFRDGYFQQYLTADGWQKERYEVNDFDNLPMTLVKDREGNPVTEHVNFPDGKVYFQIWKIEIGRNPLYLLDTNVKENKPEDRKITERLYGGNNETRIRQEIVLGIGGIRAVRRLRIVPTVCHMNEGHSAFLSLERIRTLMRDYHLSFEEAREMGVASTVFTTHTPVPAGIDIFPNDLVERYFGKYYREELGIPSDKFYSLGRLAADKHSPVFNMAHLAMNTAASVNGVSRLHGRVSREMWKEGFPEIPVEEIPVKSVTNGVHILSHLAPEMKELFVRYLGESWTEDPSIGSVWAKTDRIPDEELWRTHERRRERLIAFARSRLAAQIRARGGSPAEIEKAREVLKPGALTIGFARRFATYKRANLIFRDIERLSAILGDPEMPVQIIIAGKAHPQDEEGKKIISEIIHIASEEEFRNKIVFLENYDMNVARYLVEGCDIWLNNPRRPLEASGTSGMKVIANGGLNFSILDGWWDEAYQPDLGWKISNRDSFSDTEVQNEIESREIYTVLENEIIPQFYMRGDDGLPREWIKKMRNSIKTLTPVFNTSRMVKEYFETFYLQCYKTKSLLMADNQKKVRELNAWKEKVRNAWDHVSVISVSGKSGVNGEIKVGELYEIDGKVFLNGLSPDEVEAEIYYGSAIAAETGRSYSSVMMQLKEKVTENNTEYYIFTGSIKCTVSGSFVYTIRIKPRHELLHDSYDLRKIRWAN
ncbi:MAG: alpha-glucan family phosphorylase [Ignavibacteriaceae bacterium]|nr:alpha-glucan family phosphorylase [Ignavibacteriaceae bacterium]